MWNWKILIYNKIKIKIKKYIFNFGHKMSHRIANKILSIFIIKLLKMCFWLLIKMIKIILIKLHKYLINYNPNIQITLNTIQLL